MDRVIKEKTYASLRGVVDTLTSSIFNTLLKGNKGKARLGLIEYFTMVVEWLNHLGWFKMVHLRPFKCFKYDDTEVEPLIK